MPVVGSSCNEEHSQVQVGPQVQQEAQGEGEEEGQEGHPITQLFFCGACLPLSSVTSSSSF